MTDRADVVVVGGGIIGLAIAWRAAQQGLAVTVVDPTPGEGASPVAAGMLAPVTETHYGEEALLRLNLESADRWGAFAEALEDASGVDVHYRTEGTLAVAYDADDKAWLDDLHAYQVELGLRVETLGGAECRDLEPHLAPSIAGGVFVAGDRQVDNRAVLTALLAATERAGVDLRRTAARVRVADGRATGVTLEDSTVVDAGAVVLAAGCWSAQVGGVPDEARPAVRPVKGQILRVRGPAGAPVLGHNIRAVAKGTSLYLVPRVDGRVVIGATVEEMGFDTTVTAGAVHDLLRDAALVVPGVLELALVETRAGLRPGTPDNAPLLGPTAVPGLVVATGHHRNGVLLTPVTADSIADVVSDGAVPDVIAPFSPTRFAASGARP